MQGFVRDVSASVGYTYMSEYGGDITYHLPQQKAPLCFRDTLKKAV